MIGKLLVVALLSLLVGAIASLIIAGFIALIWNELVVPQGALTGWVIPRVNFLFVFGVSLVINFMVRIADTKVTMKNS
jgi:hypothetical protein